MRSGWKPIAARSGKRARTLAFLLSCIAPIMARRRHWRYADRADLGAVRLSFGPFLFGAPGALLALLALPVLFFIMRATPPPPQREQFPPARLLEGLRTDDQSRERAPWWLVLFRMLAATLLILAFARPSLAPQASESPLGGRTLIVIDDGWTSAPAWSEVRNAANAAIAQAERARAPVFMLAHGAEHAAARSWRSADGGGCEVAHATIGAATVAAGSRGCGSAAGAHGRQFRSHRLDHRWLERRGRGRAGRGAAAARAGDGARCRRRRRAGSCRAR